MTDVGDTDTRPDGDEDSGPGVARWVPWTAFVLSLIGLADAIYLTYDHYTGTLPICTESGAINCAKVTTSPQSEVFGIPVALLGLIFFVAVTVVNLPPLWRVRDRRVAWARVALLSGGMGMVIYLLIAELFLVGAICLYCTGVHVVTFLLFALTLMTLPGVLSRVTVGADWEPDDEGDPELEGPSERADGDAPDRVP